MALLSEQQWELQRVDIMSALRLPAGKDLDELVARLVLGYHKGHCRHYCFDQWMARRDEKDFFVCYTHNFNQSTQFADAMLAWDRSNSPDGRILLRRTLCDGEPDLWKCRVTRLLGYGRKRGGMGTGATRELAICRALLVQAHFFADSCGRSAGDDMIS